MLTLILERAQRPLSYGGVLIGAVLARVVHHPCLIHFNLGRLASVGSIADAVSGFKPSAGGGGPRRIGCRLRHLSRGPLARHAVVVETQVIFTAIECPRRHAARPAAILFLVAAILTVTCGCRVVIVALGFGHDLLGHLNPTETKNCYYNFIP